MSQPYARERIYTEDPTGGTNRVWLDRLNTAGPSIVTGLKYATSYPGGDTTSSCNLNALPDLSHLGLRDGRRLVIQSGGATRWQGFLDQAQRPTSPGAPWVLSGTGLAGLIARDQWSSGGNGYALNAAVDAAVTRGLPWLPRAVSLPSSVGTAPNNSLTLDEAFSQVGKATGTVWTLTAAGVVAMVAPPTVPAYALRATQALAPRLTGFTLGVGVYQATSTTVGYVYTSNAAAVAKFGAREGTYDMTGLGVITGGTASGYLATWLAANLAAPAYTDTIIAQTGQLRVITPAGGGNPQAMGGPVDLGTVRAGCLVQILDADPTHQHLVTAGPMNMLVAGTEYDVDNDTLTLTPVGFQGQDFLSIIYQSLGGAM